MFGKWVNNYYYGKSGKGDFRKDDLPQTRWQLFWDMLRTRLSGLFRLNLTVFVAWLPLIIALGYYITNMMNWLNIVNLYEQYLATGVLGEELTQAAVVTLENMLQGRDSVQLLADVLKECVAGFTLWCIPCILVTGPVQAGLAYVTRNWARDEHAFAWSDFKDAVKANWKQSLVISGITSIIPIIAYTSWNFYGSLASQQGFFFLIPQMLVITIALVWMLSLVFMYPIIVSYEVKTLALIKDGLMLAIARLPQTVGIRLVMLLPALIAVLVFWFTGSVLSLLVLGGYYILIGFTLARFVYASFTNGVFDKYINIHMEGVQVNRGLSTDADDDEEDEDGENAPGNTLSE